jgi:hypothetical protein
VVNQRGYLKDFLEKRCPRYNGRGDQKGAKYSGK